MELLPSQRKRLFEIIESCKVNTTNFKLEDFKDSKNEYVVGFQLQYKDSDYYFSWFDKYIHSNLSPVTFTRLVMSPGENDKIATQDFHNVERFELCEGYIRTWISNLTKELDVEDPWLKMADDVAGKEITDVKLIEQAAKEIIRRLPEAKLTPEQNTYIANQINITINIVKQNPSFDWQSLLIGLISSAVLNMTIDKATGSAIWEIIRTTVHRLLS